jgi:hypothetical protein
MKLDEKLIIYTHTICNILSYNSSKVCVSTLDVDKRFFSTLARQYWTVSCTPCGMRILLYFGRTSPRNTAPLLSQLQTHFLPLSLTSSWEDNSRSASNAIPGILWNPKVHIFICISDLSHACYLPCLSNQIYSLIISFIFRFVNVSTIILLPHKGIVWLCWFRQGLEARRKQA